MIISTRTFCNHKAYLKIYANKVVLTLHKRISLTFRCNIAIHIKLIMFHQESFNSKSIFMLHENILSELNAYVSEQEIMKAIKLIESIENFDPRLAYVLNVYLNSSDV